MPRSRPRKAPLGPTLVDETRRELVSKVAKTAITAGASLVSLAAVGALFLASPHVATWLYEEHLKSMIEADASAHYQNHLRPIIDKDFVSNSEADSLQDRVVHALDLVQQPIDTVFAVTREVNGPGEIEFMTLQRYQNKLAPVLIGAARNVEAHITVEPTNKAFWECFKVSLVDANPHIELDSGMLESITELLFKKDVLRIRVEERVSTLLQSDEASLNDNVQPPSGGGYQIGKNACRASYSLMIAILVQKKIREPIFPRPNEVQVSQQGAR